MLRWSLYLTAVLALGSMSVVAQTELNSESTLPFTDVTPDLQIHFPNDSLIVSRGTLSAPLTPTTPLPEIRYYKDLPSSAKNISKDIPAFVSDGFFKQAYSAYHQGDLNKLEALKEPLKEHPLYGYVELWSILMRANLHFSNAMKTRTENQPAPQLPITITAELARFVIAHETEYLGELARTEWARLVATSNDKLTFEMLYPQLLWNQHEPDIACWQSFFTLTKNSKHSALNHAKKLLLDTPASQSLACKRLAERVIDNEPSWAWTYALILAQKRRFSLASELISLVDQKTLPLSKERISQILNEPRTWLASQRENLAKLSGRELILAALRFLPIDLDQASIIAFYTDKKLSPQATALLWGRLGYTAALRQGYDPFIFFNRTGNAFNKAASGSFTYQGDQLLLWNARAHLRNSGPKEILEAIKMLPQSMRNEPRWIYWEGKQLQALGQSEEAEKRFLSISELISFYGLLACDELGIPYNSGVSRLTPAPEQEQLLAFEANPNVQRALQFYKLDLHFWGHREWNWALRHMPPRERLELATYAQIKSQNHRQINTSKSTGQVIFSQLFPMPHSSEILAAASAAGLNPAWVFGLIRQESRFIRMAQSSAGAIGLMQIMPGTARWVAKRIALQNYLDGHLARLETNLQIGTQYLKLIADSVNGNITLATASYNAGPIKAQTWRASLAHPLSGAAFAETLPYGETRDYVMRVATNTVHYSRYTTSPLRLSEILGTIEPKPIDIDVLP